MDLRSSSFALVAATLLATAAHASDIRVAPVVIDPLPGARTSSLTLINAETRPVQVQVRVMRWSVKDGVESLTPTTDVVASPPFATLVPDQHYLVRVVRTAEAPPVGEESYRILVDEVPDPSSVAPGSINLVVRQSIPAFFSDVPRREPQVTWALDRASAGGAMLVARNGGTRRLRVSDLSITAGGRPAFARAGLVGYVLAGEELRVPVQLAETGAAGPLRLTAMTEGGAVESPLAVRAAN